MKSLTRAFIAWIPLAITIIGICALVYGAVQQDYRQSFDDPQIQMAEDGAALINAGGTPASLVTRGIAPIDIAASISPWIAVYDQTGTSLESNGVLNNAPPKIPQGIIDDLLAGKMQRFNAPTGEDRVTWQPNASVRQAIVAVRAGNYVVVAGRNMREVEGNESRLRDITGFIMIALLVATFLATWISRRMLQI